MRDSAIEGYLAEAQELRDRYLFGISCGGVCCAAPLRNAASRLAASIRAAADTYTNAGDARYALIAVAYFAQVLVIRCGEGVPADDALIKQAWDTVLDAVDDL